MRIDAPRFGTPTTTKYLRGQEPLPRSRVRSPVVDSLVEIFTRNHLESGYRTLNGVSEYMYNDSLRSLQGLKRKILFRGSRAFGRIAEKPQAAEAVGVAKHIAFATAFGLGATVFIELATMLLGQIPIAH